MPGAGDPVSRFARLVAREQAERGQGPLRLGVDLGTANIVLSVVDDDGPVAGEVRHSSVVRDGIVVDWMGAVEAVTDLKNSLQTRLGEPLTQASVAIPPGIDEGTVKVFTNVLEAAGLEPDHVVDEPVAAARALGISDGAVIDIGHGTTGVSLLRDGRVYVSEDEPTGGHHMTLVIAGSFGLPYDEAETLKKDARKRDLVGGLIRPTLEKMALIARDVLAGHDVPSVHLVGGSSTHPRAVDVFGEVLGLEVVRPDHPLLVTPLGIAMPASAPAPGGQHD